MTSFFIFIHKSASYDISDVPIVKYVQVEVLLFKAVFPNPVPGGTPTLPVFFVSLIKHTRFNPSAH